MTIKYHVQIDAEDWRRHIQFFSTYSMRLDKQLAPAMKRTVKFAHDFVQPKVPQRTGEALNNLRADVFGYGKTLTGVVGWRGGKGTKYWYINIVEHGARAHSLVKGSKQRTKSAFARFEKRAEKGNLAGAHVQINGQWVTMEKHPGFSKRGFMAAGYSATMPVFNEEMRRAAELTLEGIKK